jgi:hypothetical protein
MQEKNHMRQGAPFPLEYASVRAKERTPGAKQELTLRLFGRLKRSAD